MSNPNPKTDQLKPFKPNWNYTPTRTIRVPVQLADQVLDYAKKLDANNGVEPSSQDSLDTAQLKQLLTEIENLKGKGALSKARALAKQCRELVG